MPGTKGLSPEQWEARLEKAASDPRRLRKALEDLEREMREEENFLHMNPSPSSLFRAILAFFSEKGGGDIGGAEHVGRLIKRELQHEREIMARYRRRLLGRGAFVHIQPYLKNFEGMVAPDRSGLQFEGFRKFKGVESKGKDHEALVFYLNKKFPGGEPANFHLLFRPGDGDLVIKRAYKMDLPRLKRPAPLARDVLRTPSPARRAGTPEAPEARRADKVERPATTGRAILAEMAHDLVKDPESIRNLVIDNAANMATRKAVMKITRTRDGILFEKRKDCDLTKTLLGHTMLKLSEELGLPVGKLTSDILPYGILRLNLSANV